MCWSDTLGFKLAVVGKYSPNGNEKRVKKKSERKKYRLGKKKKRKKEEVVRRATLELYTTTRPENVLSTPTRE